MEVITKKQTDKVCILCYRGTVKETKYGPLYSRDSVTCHNHCMLMCSNLPQNGKDDTDGIMRFLVRDIRKEANRVIASKQNRKFYTCIYCKKEGATIGCCVKKCKALFHFPCGLKNGAQYQFHGSFESFCIGHHRNLPKKEVPKENPECPICRDPIEVITASKENPMRYVVGSCCKSAFYHKKCIQIHALHAGVHFFKCPACNSENFKTEVLNQGIFLPNRDASWELDDNAFEELMVQGQCEAQPCQCDKGRDYEDDFGSIWELFPCDNCGASYTHGQCSSAPDPDSWECDPCQKMKNMQQKRARLEIESPSSGSNVNNGPS